MSHEECLAKLKQAGFINVDKWSVAPANLLALCRVMANAPHTTELDLSYCGIGDGNVAVLAKYLPRNAHLTDLRLRDNTVTDAGVQALARALKSNKALQRLDLGANNITDVGAQLLAQAAANHLALTELLLDVNQGITDASCAALAAMLRNNATLTNLNLDNTRVSPTSRASLAAALGRKELRIVQRKPVEPARAQQHPGPSGATNSPVPPPRPPPRPAPLQQPPAAEYAEKPPPLLHLPPPLFSTRPAVKTKPPKPAPRPPTANAAQPPAGSPHSTAVPTPLPTPTLTPVADFDIFLSLRFREAMDEAVAMQAALQARGLSVFLCDVAPGGDIAQAVIKALTNCKMVVLFGTATYGMQTPSSFSSYEELRYIIEDKKPYFLIKMCDRFEESQTRFWLPNTVSYYLWKPVGAARKQVPADLVEQITKKLRVIVNGGVPPAAEASTAGQHGPPPTLVGSTGGEQREQAPDAEDDDITVWLQTLKLGPELNSVQQALRELGAGTLDLLKDAVQDKMVSEDVLTQRGVRPIPARKVMRAAATLVSGEEILRNSVASELDISENV